MIRLDTSHQIERGRVFNFFCKKELRHMQGRPREAAAPRQVNCRQPFYRGAVEETGTL
jgi:hypothetical protein